MKRSFGEGAYVDWADAFAFAQRLARATGNRYRVHAADDPYGQRPWVWTFDRA